jgi:3-oxoacyl-[acyl-carrier protein] reductase
MVHHIAQNFGSIDLLVNNAGITQHSPMEDLEAATDDIWNELFDVNVKGMFYCSRAALLFMD